VTFNPEESLLASGSHDKTVGIWDLVDHKLLVLLPGHEDVVLRVAFNSQGTLLASISWDGTVKLWGMISGR
jgi:WD40 repeat protein